MRQEGFDNEKYLGEQSEAILERAAQFGGKLYLEVHEPLEEDNIGHANLISTAMQLLDEVQASRLVELDEEAIEQALREQTGMPVPISLLQ